MNHATTAVSAPRPLYWSMHRELWQNRSLYIAPLLAGCAGLLVFFIGFTHKSQSVGATDPTQPSVMLAMPYSHTAMLLIITALIVSVVYSLDALHSERQDRSILFWKSMPVSDLTTVLAKMSVPLVIVPVLAFAMSVATVFIILLTSTVVVLVRGQSVPMLWSKLPLFQMELVVLYSIVVMTLWYAPLYAWFTLVSGWAKRTVFLWAVLPVFAVCIIERLAFHTNYIGGEMALRSIGFVPLAFNLTTPEGTLIDPHLIPLSQLSPGTFLSTPDLWIGLVVAAGLIAAAVRLRRDREPI
jgi:ABC-2 type transport system permease protein